MRPQTFVITRGDSGKTLSAFLHDRLGLGWSAVRQLIRGQGVHLDGRVCQSQSKVLRKGQEVAVVGKIDPQAPAAKKPPKRAPYRVDESAPRPVIRYADKHIVVVDKPAGLTTVRHRHEREEFGRRAARYLPPTLADLLPGMLAKGDPGRKVWVRAVHRLDRDTSGLIVFARTPEAETHLGRQLRRHGVDRKYTALVRGRAESGKVESRLVDDRGDGRRGSTAEPRGGKRAVTHVQVLEELGDYALVECRLETGRTHQVRIHLGERGTPLCGERVYDRPVNGRPLPDGSDAPRPLLHASYLALEHPATGKRMHWSSRLPDDMEATLVQLRRRVRPPAGEP